MSLFSSSTASTAASSVACTRERGLVDRYVAARILLWVVWEDLRIEASVAWFEVAHLVVFEDSPCIMY